MYSSRILGGCLSAIPFFAKLGGAATPDYSKVVRKDGIQNPFLWEMVSLMGDNMTFPTWTVDPDTQLGQYDFGTVCRGVSTRTIRTFPIQSLETRC